MVTVWQRLSWRQIQIALAPRNGAPQTVAIGNVEIRGTCAGYARQKPWAVPCLERGLAKHEYCFKRVQKWLTLTARSQKTPMPTMMQLLPLDRAKIDLYSDQLLWGDTPLNLRAIWP